MSSASSAGPASAEPALPPRVSSLGAGAWLALVGVALAGIVHLPQPFTWDQAMFTTGARALDHGAALYTGYWDPKQPGIYLFYLAGGALFGFSEIGIHLFELVWMTALGAALLLALRPSFERRWALLLVPLLTSGYFYAITQDWHLTQVEGLVGLPMFLAMWASMRGARMERGAAGRFALSGVMGGVVLVFKLALLPMLGLFWLADLIAILSSGRANAARGALAAALWIAVGVAIPVGMIVAWLAARGALPMAMWTWFVFPAQAMSAMGRFRLETFIDGFSWFGRRFSPLLTFAVAGAWAGMRRGRDPLALRLVLWIAGGAFVILIQRWSYWQYQYVIFLVPLGVLAALGLEALVPALLELPVFRSRREARVVMVAAGLALFSGPLGFLALKAMFLARDRFALTPRALETQLIRGSRGGAYYKFLPEVSFLKQPGARPGPIYVVGNPLFYWLSGRDQAVARSGGVMTTYRGADDWSETAAQLRRVRPPYVFVQSDHMDMLLHAAPRTGALLALLASDYRERGRSPIGTWYELARPDSAAR